jgi:transposase-like protein
MCPSCDATDIIKYGKSRSGKQVFKCKPCGTKFTEGGAMPRRRIPPNVVGDAIVDFYDGLSYRDIQRQIETR